MFLGGDAREGIENVGIMSGTLFNGPILHR